VPPGDDAGQRRHDIRIGERVLRELHLRFRRFEVAARDIERRFGAVEGVLRDEPVVQEPQVHRPRLFGEGELRTRAFDGALALDETRLEVGRVDVGDDLPGAHGLALAHGETGHVAGDLRLHDGLPDGLQRARNRQPARERPALDIREVAGAELQRHRRPVRTGLACVALAGPQHDGAGQPGSQRQRDE
jgi:hypothetical protein